MDTAGALVRPRAICCGAVLIPAGLPGEFVAALQPDEERSGHLVVTLKYPDYVPIMQQCRVSWGCWRVGCNNGRLHIGALH